MMHTPQGEGLYVGSGLFSTLKTILSDHLGWWKQIARLSFYELKKKSRGAVLSWAWFFIKPGMYIFCFWFALDIGLRVGNGAASEGAPPYILWLCAGLIPWFFIQEMFGAGSDVLHRYSYLVNKIKFPLSGISTVYVGASMLVHILLVGVLFAIYFICGQQLDVYLLQVPILLILMFVFWDTFSIMMSQLSGLSKDFANLMKALSTPFFWLSGIIFNIKTVPIDWIQVIMQYNPVAFFAVAYRDAFYEKVWFWEDPGMCIGFAIVFVITFAMMLLIYKRFNEEVADVL